ncbi:MAG: AraC family transcriptional regulator [Lachnospiraceae bacterium]|nr:AraC family transcriptional regulator [Lachnospiraceae bacterium]
MDNYLTPESNNFILNETHHVQPKYSYHCHDVYEIYYFVSGDADYLVEGREFHLTPHSLILLSPYVLHSVKVNSSESYIRSCIFFRPEELLPERRSFLLSCFPGHSGYETQQEIFFENTQNFGLETYFRNIAYLSEQPDSIQKQYYPIMLEALLSQIHLMSQVLHPSKIKVSPTDKIGHIISYLNDHISENITLDTLSNRFYLNKYYLNRAFKKATGTTVMNYVTYKRMVLAKQYILNGDTAYEAAEKVGFSDYSAFFRAYKKVLGHSPSTDKNNIISLV